MANDGEAGPSHLCDNSPDGGQVLHVMIVKACQGRKDIISPLEDEITGGEMSREAMARQVESHQVEERVEERHHLCNI